MFDSIENFVHLGNIVASEGETLSSLIKDDLNNPRINFTYPRYSRFDFLNDGKLSPLEMYCIPTNPGFNDLKILIENSSETDQLLAEALSYLPDSKISRSLLGNFIKPRKIFEIIATKNPERAANILLCMQENPYENDQYLVEGYYANNTLSSLSLELRDVILQFIDKTNSLYAKNIRKRATEKNPFSPNKSEYPWSSELVLPSNVGELPKHRGIFEAKKIFQCQFSVAKKGENLQTFSVNDCVAIAFLDGNGNKALIHLDIGMDELTSLDNLLYQYVKSGGDLTKTKVAAVGGFEMSKKMIWAVRQRLKQAGLKFDVARLISDHINNQLLVTDDGFFDFEPQYTDDDRIKMNEVLDKIAREGNGRVATFV